MVLPPLGRVDPPIEHFSPLASVLGSAPEIPLALDESQSAPRPGGYAPAVATGAVRPPTPEELALTRKLSGAAFLSGAKSQATSVGDGASAETLSEPMRAPRTAGGGDLDALLRPSATPAVRAEVLPTQTLLLPKGAFIDCTLETAIDSTLAGMTTCITATDTFGADGKVVLLERGTKLVGETRGLVQQGSARIFVLWTEARTPTGVVVPLASPGTDELGRAGLPGAVNRHFWERFGAAILISAINGAIQAEVQSQNSGGGTVIYNPSTSTDVVTEVLKSTVNIPPTVVKAQGDRIQVLVARDLDFRSVYALRVSHER
jgi:type IV secretion system protein VirB10